ESKNDNLRAVAHEQNELAIRASLDSNNATVEIGRLQKRIAELEARTVTPPKNNVANVGDSRWMWYQRDLMWIEAIRAAGIKVKGGGI
ncbi:hypothetical protein AXA91_26425, partial [Salmonella enterica]|nr:hypothetical protein [Salmonella enterica]